MVDEAATAAATVACNVNLDLCKWLSDGCVTSHERARIGAIKF